MRTSEHASEANRNRSRATLLAGLALLVLAYAFARVRAKPPEALPIDAPPGAFSATRALAHLRVIAVGRTPRPAGSAEHERVRALIRAELDRLGYATEVQEALAVGRNGVVARVQNVIAVPRGVSTQSCVLICAHYDSVPAGPGASDDGAGVAAILEIARALQSDPPRRHRIAFLVDDAEEAGLVGARAFVDEHPLAREISCVLNLEARGTCGRSHMFETSADNAWLAEHYRKSVAHPSAISVAYEIYKRMPNDTDLTVFKDAGLPGMNFAFIGGLPRYHTPLDDFLHLDPGSLQHHGEQVLALARSLAGADKEHHAHGDAVYADIFGFVFLWAPAAWCAPIAVALVLLLGWSCRASTRRGLAFGALAAFACVIAATAVAHGLALALVMITGTDAPWSAHPWPARVAVLAGSLGAALAAVHFVARRRATEGEVARAAHALVAVAALACALTLPSAAYVLLAPALAAAILLVVRAQAEISPRAAVLVPLCAAALFLAPLLVGIEEGFEFRAGAALGAPIGLCALSLAPACVREIRGVVLALASVTAVGFATGALVAPYGTDEPAALNLVHVQDRAGGNARLFARGASGALSAEFRRRANFASTLERPVAWYRSSLGYAAPVAAAHAEEPRLERVSETREKDARIVRAHLSSPRHATRFVVDLPPKVELRAAATGATSMRHGLPLRGTVPFVGIDARGLDLEFAITTDAPIAIDLLDASFGLPESVAVIAAARPAWTTPRGEGDLSLVTARVDL